jgi:hypothetical protein
MQAGAFVPIGDQLGLVFFCGFVLLAAFGGGDACATRSISISAPRSKR